ncbi:hypothetical protein FI667_g2736, partial [Globisporangium splendens]
MPLFISSTRWGSQPEHAEFAPPPSGGCSGGGSVIGRNSENSWLLKDGTLALDWFLLESWGANCSAYWRDKTCRVNLKRPGGSGWALIFLNERTNRWELKACGYAYMGPEVTNNWCEYSALKDGLAYSAHYLLHYEVKLEVFGDSQMIIAAQNGFASIRQTELQPLAVRVNQIIANFAWISWNHTKREQNKMADLLANVAMNSKSAKILTDESRGNDQVLLSQVAALLDNDISATPSKLRNTSLS